MLRISKLKTSQCNYLLLRMILALLKELLGTPFQSSKYK